MRDLAANGVEHLDLTSDLRHVGLYQEGGLTRIVLFDFGRAQKVETNERAVEAAVKRMCDNLGISKRKAKGKEVAPSAK